ncbi:MAG: hypothetical protein EB117_14200 [Betaproteobacteria bacterium]|nr:hypothetical protein [Betaproteobacteria bacterium]
MTPARRSPAQRVAARGASCVTSTLRLDAGQRLEALGRLPLGAEFADGGVVLLAQGGQLAPEAGGLRVGVDGDDAVFQFLASHDRIPAGPQVLIPIAFAWSMMSWASRTALEVISPAFQARRIARNSSCWLGVRRANQFSAGARLTLT